MAGPLSNTKHEKYALARASGMSIEDAYVKAGYKPNRGNSARLNTNEGVLARVSELQSRVAAKLQKRRCGCCGQRHDG